MMYFILNEIVKSIKVASKKKMLHMVFYAYKETPAREPVLRVIKGNKIKKWYY